MIVFSNDTAILPHWYRLRQKHIDFEKNRIALNLAIIRPEMQCVELISRPKVLQSSALRLTARHRSSRSKMAGPQRSFRATAKVSHLGIHNQIDRIEAC